MFNYQNSQSSLNDILEKEKGKVILIDCRASWCDPCLREMPYFREAEKELEGKNIAFIYMSFDGEGSKKQWLKDVEKFGEDHNQYFVVGNFNSDLGLYLKMSSIPKYIMIDQKGNFLGYAPLPSSNEFLQYVMGIINR